MRVLSEALGTNTTFTVLDVSENNLTKDGEDMSGVTALAAAIPKCT